MLALTTRLLKSSEAPGCSHPPKFGDTGHVWRLDSEKGCPLLWGDFSLSPPHWFFPPS